MQSQLGKRVAQMLAGAALFAPELLDVEVLSALRKGVLSKRLSPSQAAQAIADLAASTISRLPHAPLLADAWSLRHNVTAYDAFYVAAARAFDAELVTADGPLSRAPEMGIKIQNVRIA